MFSRLSYLFVSLVLFAACGGSSGALTTGGDVPAWGTSSRSSTDSTHIYGYAFVLADDSADATMKARTAAQAFLETGVEDYKEELRLRLVSETSDETFNSVAFMGWYRMVAVDSNELTYDFYYPKTKGEEAAKAYARVAMPLNEVHTQLLAAFSASRFNSAFSGTAVAASLKK